jgi:hypothetical protein
MLETLGYAVSGAIVHGANPTGWGETILGGINDVSLTNTYESGLSGSTGVGFAQLVFADLQPGWYTIYVGGTNHAGANGLFDLSVSASPVPVPAAAWLMGSGLAVLATMARRRRAAA